MLVSCTIIFTENEILYSKDILPVRTKQFRTFIHLDIIVKGDHLSTIKITYKDGEGKIHEFNIFELEHLHNSMNGEYKNIEKALEAYLKNLSDEEKNMIINEYSNYLSNITLIQAFLVSLASYISFIFLHENNLLNLPFSYNLGDTSDMCNQNMFEFLSLPLMAINKGTKGVLQKFSSFVQVFINLWSPLFVQGSAIDSYRTTRLAIEIVTGLSIYIHDKLSSIEVNQEILMDNAKSVLNSESILERIEKLERKLLDVAIANESDVDKITEITKVTEGTNVPSHENISFSVPTDDTTPATPLYKEHAPEKVTYYVLEDTAGKASAKAKKRKGKKK